MTERGWSHGGECQAADCSERAGAEIVVKSPHADRHGKACNEHVGRVATMLAQELAELLAREAAASRPGRASMTTAHETLRELVGGKRYVVVAAQELATPEAVILVARSFPGRLIMPNDVGTLHRPNLVAEGRAYAIDLNALEPKIV